MAEVMGAGGKRGREGRIALVDFVRAWEEVSIRKGCGEW